MQFLAVLASLPLLALASPMPQTGGFSLEPFPVEEKLWCDVKAPARNAGGLKCQKEPWWSAETVGWFYDTNKYEFSCWKTGEEVYGYTKWYYYIYEYEYEEYKCWVPEYYAQECPVKECVYEEEYYQEEYKEDEYYEEEYKEDEYKEPY